MVINALELRNKLYYFLWLLFLEFHIYFSWINFSLDTVHPPVFLVGVGANDFILPLPFFKIYLF